MPKKQSINLNNKTILVTGSPGFIGANLVIRLLRELTGGTVVSLDNMNDYYDPKLKEYRLSLIDAVAQTSPVNHIFIRGSIADKALVDSLFQTYRPSVVVNLAAQAGVRYSIDHPDVYIESNIIGFYNILEACRHSYDHDRGVKHLIFASSSSVYGNQEKTPFSTTDNVDHPISLYAATKKFNELMAYTYSHLYGIPATGLRFFTVYGPYGRPDMAYFKFANLIRDGKPIKIYNNGDMLRDFTYVDDIVAGIEHMLCNPPKANTEGDKYKVYNIGNNSPVKLMDFIETLEKALGKTAEKEYLPMQPGDVYQTYADVSELERDFDFQPKTTIAEGLKSFADWYKEFYLKK